MNLIPISSPSFLEPADIAARPDWAQLFGNNNPLVLEIGCGIGDFVAQTARNHPEWNFIALDFYNKGCLKTTRRIDQAGLPNVRVVRDEARSFLERCIEQGSLRRVIINCPDPWPKQRHRKRRLVNPSFVTWLSGYLQPGGELHFATDFDDYGLDVAGFMPSLNGFENLLHPDPYRHHLEGYPLSKYMRKFMAEGKQIYFVQYRTVSQQEGTS